MMTFVGYPLRLLWSFVHSGEATCAAKWCGRERIPGYCHYCRRHTDEIVRASQAEWGCDLRSAALVLSRAATDTGVRHPLDKVIAALGFSRAELEDELRREADSPPPPPQRDPDPERRSEEIIPRLRRRSD